MKKLFSKIVFVVLPGIMISGTDAWSIDVGADAGQAYSGVYESRQIIPNSMATLCQMSAEDMLKDKSKIGEYVNKCIKKLVLKRRNSNADTAREGLADLNEIKADQLKDMISLATAKGAAVADYFAKKAEETAKTNAKAKTVNDVDGSAVNTVAQSTIDINTLGDLYVEQLKYLAISNIENIEKSVVDDEESEDVADVGIGVGTDAIGNLGASSSGDYATTETSQTKVEEDDYANAWIYKGEGICEFCIKRKRR